MKDKEHLFFALCHDIALKTMGLPKRSPYRCGIFARDKTNRPLLRFHVMVICCNLVFCICIY